MEPMALGSPPRSQADNPNQYLPSFLMGGMQVPTTPRNKLSPNKRSKNVSFAASPRTFSPSHQPMAHRSIFNHNVSANYSGSQGPPVVDLFDCMRDEIMDTPTRDAQSHLTSLHFRTPMADLINAKVAMFEGNQSFQQHEQTQNIGQSDSPFFSINTSCNGSGCMSSPFRNTESQNVSSSTSYMLQCPPIPRLSDFWITVYGFPPGTISTILQHFIQCGTIIDRVLPPQNGNWVHLKYASRLECDKALTYNQKILGKNIMIGVTHCKERAIIENDNLYENQPCALRPLSQAAYKSAQNESSVVNNDNRAPQKSSGVMNFVMDLIFGW